MKSMQKRLRVLIRAMFALLVCTLACSLLTSCSLGGCTALPCNQILDVEVNLNPKNHKDLALYRVVFQTKTTSQSCSLDDSKAGCHIFQSFLKKDGKFQLSVNLSNLPELTRIVLERESTSLKELPVSEMDFRTTEPNGAFCGTCRQGNARIVE